MPECGLTPAQPTGLHGCIAEQQKLDRASLALTRLKEVYNTAVRIFTGGSVGPITGRVGAAFVCPECEEKHQIHLADNTTPEMAELIAIQRLFDGRKHKTGSKNL